jgi:tRNA-dihydrouridine synthase C
MAIVSGGADELAVHARTKADGYRPPAYWERIAEIRAAVSIPVIANGEIWTVGDALTCRERSGCHPLMLGRGMVSDPGLALAILAADRAGDQEGEGCVATPSLAWADIQPLLVTFWHLVSDHIEPRARGGRLKQWLNYLRRRYPEAEEAYGAVRTINDPRLIVERLGLSAALSGADEIEEEHNARILEVVA